MGTRFELVLVGTGAGTRQPDLLAAGEAAISEIEWWHKRLSRFERDSDVSFIAREAHLRTPSNPISLDPDFFDLLVMCDEARVRSGGAFDVRVGAEMDRWIAGEPQRGPSTRETMPEFVLDPQRRTLHAPGGVPLRLDLGGVAKGFALDRAAAILIEAGIDNALIHAGTSSIIAIGPGPEGNGWKVRIDPGSESAAADADHGEKAARAESPLDVKLRDQAVSVSSPRGRTVQSSDESHATRGHILDPRAGTAAPLGRSVVALSPLASPLASSSTAAAACEIWSTTLVVAPELLDQLPASMSAFLHYRMDHANPEWRVHPPQRSDLSRSTPARSTRSAAHLAAMEIL
jgi:thiamine biosynthesis lipoprotein